MINSQEFEQVAMDKYKVKVNMHTDNVVLNNNYNQYT